MARINAQMVVAARFGQGWAAQGLFHGLWRAAGAARGIPPAMVIASGDGRPSTAFLGLWRAAFAGSTAPRAGEAIVTSAGKPAQGLLDAFVGIP